MKKYKLTLAAAFGICVFPIALATALITASSFAQTARSGASPAVKATPAYPWALGVRQDMPVGAPPTAEEIKEAQVPGPSPWKRTMNNPPANLGQALLLTDGTVIAHEENDTGASDATPNWYKLTPDINGSYIKGTWSKIASLPAGYGPLFFGSAVLPDGRVIVEGGEYNISGGPAFTNMGAIYDPVANAWTAVLPPAGWSKIGDASAIVLDDGTLMLANTTTKQAATFNPQTLTWTSFAHAEKFDVNDEEGWTLLPSGQVLTVDCYVNNYNANGKKFEIFDPSTNKWSVAGVTPVQLWSSGKACGADATTATYEIGPQLLLPNNTVFATGSNQCGKGHTAIYDVASGTWTAGPNFPNSGGNTNDVCDGPAALEPNGKMLIVAGKSMPPFSAPATFFEWNGSTLTKVAGPPNAVNTPSFQGHLLVLPTGQILYTDFTKDVEVLTPSAGQYNYAPSASPPSAVPAGTSFTLEGFKFNGLSQASAYGDDAQNATNYPIVRITNAATGHVFYCRTHDHSFMGVAYTGPVATNVDVPANTETGSSFLEVVANGIPSQQYSIQIQ